eukprot:scaffold91019_cov62-Phaeocystis_antarctica.AAC.1
MRCLLLLLLRLEPVLWVSYSGSIDARIMHNTYGVPAPTSPQARATTLGILLWISHHSGCPTPA